MKTTTAEPNDTIETLAARIRAAREGLRIKWMWTPEEAAARMLLAAKLGV